MAFYRYKSIPCKNGKRYTYVYLVENTWIPELKSPRQKNLAYIGKCGLEPFIAKKIFERDNYKCQNSECGATNDLTIDHKIPLSKGGTNNEDNLQTLCKICNLKKRNL